MLGLFTALRRCPDVPLKISLNDENLPKSVLNQFREFFFCKVPDSGLQQLSSDFLNLSAAVGRQAQNPVFFKNTIFQAVTQGLFCSILLEVECAIEQLSTC